MDDSPSRPFRWPGGIPPEVKPDLNSDWTFEGVSEAAKGWLLFVTENWVPRSAVDAADGDYEVRQRRTLVEKWAKADQGFRDSYHRRAPLTDAYAYPAEALHNTISSYPTEGRFLCLAPLSANDQANRSKWIKLCILSYRLDGEAGQCLEQYGPPYHDTVDVNGASFQYRDVLPWFILDMANFHAMVMTSKGTVLFTRWLHTWFLVNQEDLDTGQIAAVSFKHNGEPSGKYKRRAFNMHDVSLMYIVLGKSLDEVEEQTPGGLDDDNTELDMSLPILGILDGANERGELDHFLDGDRDSWERAINVYAPGYLRMEAEGNEADYDHAFLAEEGEAEEILDCMGE